MPENDWLDERLLDLACEKQSHRAVVMLVVGIMMNQLVQAWAYREHCSPLERRGEKQGNYRRSRGRV